MICEYIKYISSTWLNMRLTCMANTTGSRCAHRSLYDSPAGTAVGQQPPDHHRNHASRSGNYMERRCIRRIISFISFWCWWRQVPTRALNEWKQHFQLTQPNTRVFYINGTSGAGVAALKGKPVSQSFGQSVSQSVS